MGSMQIRGANAMLKRNTVTAAMVICLMGLARLAMAQNSSDQFRPFNGFFADLFDDGSQPQRPPRPVQNSSTNNYNTAPTATLQRTPTRAPPPLPEPPSDTGLPSRPASSSRSSATGNNYSFQFDDGSSTGGPALDPPSPSASLGGNAAIPSTVPVAPAGLPLHQRLNVFRQSPFGDVAQTTPSTANSPAAAAPAEPATSRPTETPAVAQQTPAATIGPAAVLQDPPAATPPAEALQGPPAAPATAALQGPPAAKPATEALQAPRLQHPGRSFFTALRLASSHSAWQLPSPPRTPDRNRAF